MADLLCPVVIGRSAETGALRSALAAARDGAGAVVFLTGEAGIGKSRLARELAAEARACAVRATASTREPATIWPAMCRLYSAGTSLRRARSPVAPNSSMSNGAAAD